MNSKNAVIWLLSGFKVLLEAPVSICADKSAYFAGHDQRADSQSAGSPHLKRCTKKVNWIPLPDPLAGPQRSSDKRTGISRNSINS
jgi:hypothetical protein